MNLEEELKDLKYYGKTLLIYSTIGLGIAAVRYGINEYKKSEQISEQQKLEIKILKEIDSNGDYHITEEELSAYKAKEQ